ncbi:MAG: glutamate-5-semialdehyde dehydrogenase [Planctomycetes bacterium]|nr:glutamate-5-semialdehyde dehydrogenase [Planctomycetota bacterium]
MNINKYIFQMGQQAQQAARQLAALDTATKNCVLLAMADGITNNHSDITSANTRDLEAGRAAGLTDAMLDRLALDDDRIKAMAAGLKQIAELPDPIGQVLSVNNRPNGLTIHKVRVGLGVIAMIYESRPNVTADAAGLCFKAGSAVILRGGSEAQHSNAVIFNAMQSAGISAGLPEHAIQLIDTTDRAAVHELLQLDKFVDLVIPRGGESLIRAVAEHSKVPVLKHYKGVCHVYVDREADLDMASKIVINAKCQRPGVCNAAETLLVHEEVAQQFLPHITKELLSHNVELRGDERTQQIVEEVKPATEEDWTTEYLDLILSIRVVENLTAAIEHINNYGSHHSDVIVTADEDAASQFTRDVDSATVYINASCRFTDGFEFGMGAEIGISTDKFHARGPCGLNELTTYKYIIKGTGQIRK